MTKRTASWLLASVTIITVFFGVCLKDIGFNYDFDSFFSSGDADYERYVSFRETFENDNDYVLVGIENDGKSIFDSSFIKRAVLLQKDLEKNEHSLDVQSILNGKDVVAYSIPFSTKSNIKTVPYFHHSDYSKLKADSAFIFSRTEIVNNLVSQDAKSCIIAITATPEIKEQAAASLVHHIDSCLIAHGFEDSFLAGKSIAEISYVDRIQVELMLFSSISIVLVLIFLWVTYRSIWGLIIPTTVVLMSTIWTIGFMVLVGQKLSVLATLIPPIILIVGVSDVIHFLAKYLTERKIKSNTDAIIDSIKDVGLATLLTSVTTALGFFTLLTANIEPVQNFGLYTGIGVLFSYIVTMLFLPALLMVIKLPTGYKQFSWESPLRIAFIWLLQKRTIVKGAFVLITGLGLFFLSKIEVNAFLVGEVAKDDPLKVGFDYFEKSYSGARPFELVVELSDSASLTSDEVTEDLITIEYFVKDLYDTEVLNSILTIYRGSSRTMNGGYEEYFSVPKDRITRDELLRPIRDLPEVSQLISSDGKQLRFTGKIRDIGSQPFLKLKNEFDSTLDSKLHSGKIKAHITGSAYLIDKSNHALSFNIMWGLGLAFVIVSIIMALLFRSLKMVLIALIPNAIPLILIAGLMGLLGVDLKVSTSIIFTIAFGIAVDDTIHFMSKLKIELHKGRSYLYAIKRSFLGTGKAIIVTSIILVAGFLSMTMSAFEGTFYTGLLISLTLLFAVLTDLMLLPLLLLWAKPKK